MNSVTVFISYAHEDIEAARRLNMDLKAEGVEPWLAEESLLAGQSWKVEVQNAIKKSQYFIAVLSTNSVKKKGYVQKERRYALEILDEFPDSDIYVIPIRLDDCEPSHEKLQELHRVDMFPNWKDGLEKILRALGIESRQPNDNFGDKDDEPKVEETRELIKIILRDTPIRLSDNDIDRMAKEKGFNLASRGVIGNFRHEFEPQTLKGKEVIIDHATSLMWQQSATSNTMTWEGAQDYAKQINIERYAGFPDWRLPTIEELISLLEPTENNKGLCIDPVFDTIEYPGLPMSCWSADEVENSDSRLAWITYYQFDGGVGSYHLWDYARVRLVRHSLRLLPNRHPFEPEMIFIPAGEFRIGRDPEKDDLIVIEGPEHTLNLPEYHLARTPVTNTEYAAFVEAARYDPPKHFKKGRPPKCKVDHPVVYVSYHDAIAYCQWLSEVTGKHYGLPSEAEWEKGARGTDARIFPWGNDWDPKRVNSKEAAIKDTTEVGRFPKGASPYGLLGMAGNVWEWTRSLWGKKWAAPDFWYPYKPTNGREDFEAEEDMYCVVRGGSHINGQSYVRCAWRFWEVHGNRKYNVGFRVALPPSLKWRNGVGSR